jgi:uncharacterized membrane protein YidH (DUF202 family)
MFRLRHLAQQLRRASNSAKKPSESTTTDVFSSVVPNTGSTARDHLANERTFLAWARTGLTFVGLGVAIDSLVRVSQASEEAASASRRNKSGRAVKQEEHAWREMKEDKWKTHVPATALVMTGGAVLTFSTFRYFRVQRVLMTGGFPLNRVGMGAVILSTSVVVFASLMMTISDEIINTAEFGIVIPVAGSTTTKKAIGSGPKE